MKMLELGDVENIYEKKENERHEELFVNVGNFRFTSARLFPNTHSLTLRLHTQTQTQSSNLHESNLSFVSTLKENPRNNLNITHIFTILYLHPSYFM